VVWYGTTTFVALAVVACTFVLPRAFGPAQQPGAAPSPATALPQVRAGFHLGVFEPEETVSYS